MIMDATGLAAVVAALQTVLTTDAFFTNLAALVPVIGGCLVFAFTYYIVRRIIKKAQKGKAGI